MTLRRQSMISSDLPGKLKKFRACVLTGSTLTFSIGSYKMAGASFPKGNNTNHLSIYLDVPDPAVLPSGRSRYAQFSLAVIDQIHNQNTVRKGKQHEFRSEESDSGFTSFMTLSELHDPRDVEADITGISGGEVSLLEPVQQDVAPPVGKEANRALGLSEVTPVGDTFAIIRAGVHASTGQASNNIRGHNILLKNAVLDSEVNFLSYRVSSEAFLVLERIHNLHNDTFIKFSIRGSNLQTILLESFASFIESMSTIRVSDVNEAAMHRAAISIKDFELVGLNLSWLKQKLDEAERVNKHSESVNFLRQNWRLGPGTCPNH
ncbi:Ubiquitin carboxyl-terminal hydrolase 12 [Camellia lanceoleosa]|uniref:Ubiquitin carboxyl-terminal hydrolase 12 n=1 Tax=Camellia lanceoleosa TaxID=1840588 RepID=A0ACC0ITX3_9ERIC|nr:Ubiquitin carboxyl-terminal hydrolase 12 [Camellia lanceoleosa]